MYTSIFQEIGLAKNEARIYEMLLSHNESAVGNISNKSGVHRRNVYDSLNRLIEKGLVFEIIEGRENRYQAVAPNKLMELLKEKEESLLSIMPSLETLYGSTPHKEEVFIYRGVEGLKNYFRDILRISEDVYTLGAKGGWLDTRIEGFARRFITEAKKKKIEFNLLYDKEVSNTENEIIKLLGKKYRFLPKEYSTPSVIEVFGDHMVIVTTKDGEFNNDISLTVIINQQVADSFRVWFQFLWSVSQKPDITSKK